MSRRFVYFTLLFFFLSFFSCQSAKIKREIRPEVRAVFPSSDTLSENLLRMYIHFSKPMKPLGNLEKITLENENGQEIVGAIFNNVYELWDQNQQQLTIILDPARVKTGLNAHEQLGRALQAGHNYRLVIDRLEDAEGNSMKEVYTKSFYVTEPDHQAPDQSLWTLHVPKSQSKTPLRIHFPQMLDRLSLLQRIQLRDENDQVLAGKIEIKNWEREWQFVPEKNWTAGNHVLYIHTRLEDPAGNNLNGLFDHQIGGLKNEQEGVIETILIKIK